MISLATNIAQHVWLLIKDRKEPDLPSTVNPRRRPTRGVSNRTVNFNSGQGQINRYTFQTGLKHIQACSFANPKLVPGWADAEKVVESFDTHEDVNYTGLYFNGMSPIGHWHLRTNLRSLARFLSRHLKALQKRT